MKQGKRCKVCAMDRFYRQRLIYTDRKKHYDDRNKFCIDYDQYDDTYNLDIQYDCGYGTQTIYNIKYCPMCGRKLKDGFTH